MAGVTAAAFSPAALMTLEMFAPSHVGKGGFAKAMRLAGFIGVAGGFLYFYQRSSRTSETSRVPLSSTVVDTKGEKTIFGEDGNVKGAGRGGARTDTQYQRIVLTRECLRG